MTQTPGRKLPQPNRVRKRCKCMKCVAKIPRFIKGESSESFVLAEGTRVRAQVGKEPAHRPPPKLGLAHCQRTSRQGQMASFCSPKWQRSLFPVVQRRRRYAFSIRADCFIRDRTGRRYTVCKILFCSRPIAGSGSRTIC